MDIPAINATANTDLLIKKQFVFQMTSLEYLDVTFINKLANALNADGPGHLDLQLLK